MILLPISNSFYYNQKGIEIVAKDLQQNNTYGVIVQVTTPYFIYGFHCNVSSAPEEIIRQVVAEAASKVKKFDQIYSRMLLDNL